MPHWSDERSLPEGLLELITVPDIPECLRAELLKAQNELKQYGAVTYVTKARVEYLIHKHYDLILGLDNDEHNSLETNEGETRRF